MVPLVVSLIAAPSLARAGSVAINWSFDSSWNSVDSPTKASATTALNTVAGYYHTALTTAGSSNDISVNVSIGWGSGGGLVAGELGSTSVATVSSNYTSVKSYLASFGGVLPASNPAGALNYLIPNAEAKALGALAGNNSATDAFIGFATSATATWDFNHSNGVSANTYDFMGVAEHEFAHALGRLTYLNPDTTPFFATPLDVFRYSGVGITSFSYSTASYASIDGGVTSLGRFDNTAGGDGADWLSPAASHEAENAILYTGQVLSLSPQDIKLLNVLGYVISGDTSGLVDPSVSPYGATVVATPEPATLSVLAIGATTLGLLRRRSTRPSAL